MIGPAAKSVRPAAVAGRFYPGEAVALRELVESLLASAAPPGGPAPKALIVPHAGYIFSGPIAASAYALLAPARAEIKRIVLLGPAHYEDFAGLALSSAGWFATPLGLVKVDAEAAEALAGLPQAKVLDAAHEREHSLEVQLPFLQVVLGEFSVVPLAAGETSPKMVREVLEALWGGPETRIVISSDLSHFYDAETAQSLDRMTASAIEALQPD